MPPSSQTPLYPDSSPAPELDPIMIASTKHLSANARAHNSTPRHYTPAYPPGTHFSDEEEQHDSQSALLRAPSPRPSIATTNPDAEVANKEAAAIAVREIMRTPSPTPSEHRVLKGKIRICDWKWIVQQLRHPFGWINKGNIWGISIVLLIITFFSLFLAFEQQISDAMRPATEWMRDTPGGWLIPIGILFVLSFPPLFGHDIIAVLCGDVWGIWIGFAIVAAGTFLGEIANYYAFQYCCLARGRALEHKRLKYGLYAAVVREGGVGVTTVMRYTFIPGHFVTAVYSTCGMSVWIYIISAFLSLPKQLAVVYIGVSKESTDPKANTLATGLKIGVLSVNILLTFVAMWYINRRMDEVKHEVVYERRKARQAAALAALDSDVRPPLVIDVRVPPAASDSDVFAMGPLGATKVAAPQPSRAGGSHMNPIMIDTASLSPTARNGSTGVDVLDSPGLTMRQHTHTWHAHTGSADEVTPWALESQSQAQAQVQSQGQSQPRPPPVTGRTVEVVTVPALPPPPGEGKGWRRWRA